LHLLRTDLFHTNAVLGYLDVPFVAPALQAQDVNPRIVILTLSLCRWTPGDVNHQIQYRTFAIRNDAAQCHDSIL
jgi:hypothetical protein